MASVGVWGHLDSLARDDLIEYVRRIEALGYTSLWVPDVVGREPFVLSALLLSATDSLGVGTSIASIWGRGPQATRMAAMTLHEASGGRFVLGLGVSHPHMAERLHGQQYDRPLTRLREYLGGYRAARYNGPTDPAGREPSVLLAALREKMLRLAGSDADGALAYLVTPDRVRWMRSILDAAASATGRRPRLVVTLPVVPEEGDRARAIARAYLPPYLRTPNYQASWSQQGFSERDWEKPGSDGLIDAMVAWGDQQTLRARVREMVDAGADEVDLIPLAPDGTTERLSTLELLAPAIGPARA